MTTKVVVPALGESIVEATVGRWHKHEGDHVAAGETLVELETDKVNLEVAAQHAGVLARIAQQEGADVKIGDVLAEVDEAATAAAGAGAADPAPTPGAAAALPDVAPHPPAAEQPPEHKATPVARQLAQEQGIDLTLVPAGGAGRVTKQDVAGYLEQQKEQPAPAPAQTPAASQPAAPTQAGRREERVRLSRRRRTIAQRLVEAQQTAAMLTTFNEIDMSAVIDIRKRRKEAFEAQHGVGLGFMSFFVKAAIGALKAFPLLNAEVQGDEVVTKGYYDIGIAVGAAEGLVVPVLRNADQMTFAGIEKAIKDFAQKAESGALSIEDLRGGTFTVTNGGVFGSLLSTPILNTPQVGILGLHKIEERPIALAGQVVVRPMMYVALTYDHRIVDGREAVQFLVRVKQLIEDPVNLLLES